jgi:hypothetical protein
MQSTQTSADPALVTERRAVRRISVQQPGVSEHEVVFRWTVDPSSDLYRVTSFRLNFPDGVPLHEVPAALWWTVALLCLHPQWPLLRPCRVELPVELPPGEREFWLRLLDAAVATLEAHRGSGNVERSIELRDRGPQIRPRHAPDHGAVATAFSGGKDSLLQVGLLTELGQQTIAVTTTSPLPPLSDHQTPRRRSVLEEISRRRNVELVEVGSDFRACWRNDFPGELGYPVAVNELTDAFLYLAAMLVVGWTRGAPRLLLASEAEVQESVVQDERVVQQRHFMYSAATQQAVDALLARYGMRHGSLIYPLRSGQVQRLLWTRYPDLRGLQYSCWRVGPGEATCSACSQCLRIALAALAAGGSPAEMGIDLARLLVSMRDWLPSRPSGAGLPDDQVKRSLHAQVARDLAATPLGKIARELRARDSRRFISRDTVRALRAYARLRSRVLAEIQPGPAPGYRAGYLALVDAGLRDRVAAIYDEAFPRAPAAEHADLLDRTRSLAGWIAAPLGEEA